MTIQPNQKVRNGILRCDRFHAAEHFVVADSLRPSGRNAIRRLSPPQLLSNLISTRLLSNRIILGVLFHAVVRWFVGTL